MDDSLGMLRFAGYKARKPDISNLPTAEARKVAQQTLSQVKKQLCAVINDFKAKALFFANLQVDSKPSLANQFFEQMLKHNNFIEQGISKESNKPRPKF